MTLSASPNHRIAWKGELERLCALSKQWRALPTGCRARCLPRIYDGNEERFSTASAKLLRPRTNGSWRR